MSIPVYLKVEGHAWPDVKIARGDSYTAWQPPDPAKAGPNTSATRYRVTELVEHGTNLDLAPDAVKVIRLEADEPVAVQMYQRPLDCR